jgi:tetratricopeptide (TPR) repeat protein
LPDPLKSAELLLDASRPADASRILVAFLAKAPDSAQAWCLFSRAQLESGEYSSALQSANRAVQLTPDDEWPHRLCALGLLNLGKAREALRAAKAAECLDPNNSSVLHVLARCYLANRKRSQARSTAERLLHVAPSWSQAHELLGLVALHERRWKDAEASCRKALELEPELWTAHNNLGLALQGQNRREEAVEALHAAARLNPGADLARSNLRESVSNHLGRSGWVLAAYVVLLWCAAYRLELDRLHASAPGYVTLGVLLIPAGLIAYYVRRARRMQRLSQPVRAFHRDELRRGMRQDLRELLKLILTMLGLIIALPWTICVFYYGFRGSGLLGSAAILYLASLGMTGAGVAWAVADHRKSREGERRR